MPRGPVTTWASGHRRFLFGRRGQRDTGGLGTDRKVLKGASRDPEGRRRFNGAVPEYRHILRHRERSEDGPQADAAAHLKVERDEAARGRRLQEALGRRPGSSTLRSVLERAGNRLHLEQHGSERAHEEHFRGAFHDGRGRRGAVGAGENGRMGEQEPERIPGLQESLSLRVAGCIRRQAADQLSAHQDFGRKLLRGHRIRKGWQAKREGMAKYK